MRMSSLMSDSDVFGATLSGDGRYLAYVKGPTGQWTLWVRQVATGSDVQILTPQTNAIRGVSFSPDGNYLYYLGTDPETPRYSTLFEVPSLGGTPRKRIFDVDSALTFSPDGERAAFVRGVSKLNQNHLVIADLETGQEEVLAVTERPDEIHRLKPAWSPDGARIVVVWHTSSEKGVQHALVGIGVADGGRETVSEPSGPNLGSLNWSPDGRGLIGTTEISGSAQSSQIFFFPYPQGRRVQITNDLDAYSAVSLSTDGASIAALRTSADSSLWLVAAQEKGSAQQITPRSSTEGIRDIIALNDGAIGFTARKDGDRPIWIMAEDGSARRQITSQTGGAWAVFSLPHGRGLVFTQSGDGESGVHVWRVDLDGGNLRQLTNGAGERLMALSPDGKTLLFTRSELPNELWSVALDGGEPLRFLDRFNGIGRYSPDGRLFFHNVLEEIDGRQRNVYYIVPTGGGEPLVRIQPPGGAADFAWLEDGSGLTYTLTIDGVQNLWRQPADGGEPVQLTHFAEGRIPDHRHAPDGTRILVERSTGGLENIWTIRSDGTEPAQITDFRSGQIFDATWTRDGASLVVLQGDVRREVVLIEQ
jgi:Tol biopolymer transport system component